MTSLHIGPGTRVTLHFSLALADGTVVDSNFDSEPAVFEVGDGNLLPAFEEALFGLEAGEESTFEIPPESAFGEHHEDNIKRLKKTDFPDEITLEEGLVLAFTNANSEIPGVVVAVEGDWVTVDFNHPLSGRELTFSVAILEVEPVVTH